MKKLTLLALAAIISFSAFAANPTTKELASVDAIILSKVSDLESGYEAQNKLVELQEGKIDSLAELVKQAGVVIKQPVTSKEDFSYLLGAILGLISYVVTNLLFKIAPLKAWVDEKFSKSGFTVALGLLGTAIATVIAYVNGGVELSKIAVWLIGAWGTHFFAFVTQVKKVAKSVE